MESEPMLTPREKSLLPEKSSEEEERTHEAGSCRTANLTHFQLSYSGPTRAPNFRSLAWLHPGHIEGFQPEWCISTIYHAWDTPFWLGTLELHLHSYNHYSYLIRDWRLVQGNLCQHIQAVLLRGGGRLEGGHGAQHRAGHLTVHQRLRGARYMAQCSQH